MKRLLIYALTPCVGILSAIGVIVTMSACATSTMLPPEQRQIQEIIETDKSQDELYVTTRTWMTRAFKEAQEVIQYEDKEAGIIIGKGLTPATDKAFKILAATIALASSAPTGKPYLGFTITTEIKESRIRVTIDQIYVMVLGLPDESPIETVEAFEKAKPDLQAVMSDLKNFLKQPEEEW